MQRNCKFLHVDFFEIEKDSHGKLIGRILSYTRQYSRDVYAKPRHLNAATNCTIKFYVLDTKGIYIAVCHEYVAKSNTSLFTVEMVRINTIKRVVVYLQCVIWYFSLFQFSYLVENFITFRKLCLIKDSESEPCVSFQKQNLMILEDI